MKYFTDLFIITLNTIECLLWLDLYFSNQYPHWWVLVIALFCGVTATILSLKFIDKLKYNETNQKNTNY